MRALILSVALAATLTSATAAGATPPGGDTITLLTGDTVTLSAAGATVRPAAGREGIPITRYRENGHLYAVPADVGRLIATGRLDRRLFDVTELVRLGYHDDATIPVIQDGRPAKAHKGARLRSLTSGGTLWLDGVRTLGLDHTVPRIGAPAAWEAGLTGEGVTVAERNFSDSADNVDRIGHGTHVASTIAGKGARYHGVAAGARLLDAKVFDDDGYAHDSAIIAALRWAVESGAKVVNMSLGADDTPGTDPLEAAIEELSASKGVLVVVAAGNKYRPETVSSPASTDAALAVGAVDGSDAMASFSSRGPRPGDGAVKPEIVAPGVAVTAAGTGGGSSPGPTTPHRVSLDRVTCCGPACRCSATRAATRATAIRRTCGCSARAPKCRGRACSSCRPSRPTTG